MTKIQIVFIPMFYIKKYSVINHNLGGRIINIKVRRERKTITKEVKSS